ncbi:MAG: hypothetical protein JNJ86_11920 [Chitinophagaceae bacterium]|nr:hypothetical protein [Chitinophagaceae bacterium]
MKLIFSATRKYSLSLFICLAFFNLHFCATAKAGIYPPGRVFHTNILSFYSALKNNSAHLEWFTESEENDEYIILQRSDTVNQKWIDIARFDMKTGNDNKRYSYDDILSEKGSYSYRIEISYPTGRKIYTEMVNVRFNGVAPALYPNPATDYIYINNSTNQKIFFVTDIHLRQWELPLQKSSHEGISVADTRQLPKGMYFGNLSGQKIRFNKQ